MKLTLKEIPCSSPVLMLRSGKRNGKDGKRLSNDPRVGRKVEMPNYFMTDSHIFGIVQYIKQFPRSSKHHVKTCYAYRPNFFKGSLFFFPPRPLRL